MPEVACEIIQWIGEGCPGWVEARLVDAQGTAWLFRDKAPIFSSDNLTMESSFPVVGAIRCRIVEENQAGGFDVIDTSEPDGVTAIDGLTSRFTVPSHLVAR